MFQILRVVLKSPLSSRDLAVKFVKMGVSAFGLSHLEAANMKYLLFHMKTSILL